MTPELKKLLTHSSTNCTVVGGTVYDYLNMTLTELRDLMSVTRENNPLIVIDQFMSGIREIK